MNRDYLNQLLENPSLISETDIYALEQLCRKFPYFSVPFLLLAHARRQKNDYRASDTLHAAALRTSVRPWLRAFIEPEIKLPLTRVVPATPPTTATEVLPTQPEPMPEKEVSVFEDNAPPLTIEQTTSELSLSAADHIIPKEEKPEVHRLNIHESLPAYSIEQFFPETRESFSPEAPKDFYSWLKQPRREDSPPPVSVVQEKKKDALIEHFLKTNPSISRPKKEFFNPLNVAKKSEQMDDTLVTETLAHIYWKQGNLKAALQAFERLILKFPEKRPYFAGLIQKISNEIKQS